jgi:hypothetical protein
MNLRTLTLRHLGWCPGVNSIAMRIPDKEYSDRRVFAWSLSIFIVILGSSIYFSYAGQPQPSYSWDIEFTEAVYDDFYGMYRVEREANLDGDYNVSFWVDPMEGENMLIRLYYKYGAGREELKESFIITDGVIFYPPDEIGSLYNSAGPWRASTVWRAYSSSRDLRLHIRIQYLRRTPVWHPP